MVTLRGPTAASGAAQLTLAAHAAASLLARQQVWRQLVTLVVLAAGTAVAQQRSAAASVGFPAPAAWQRVRMRRWETS